jgi:hemoglobin-like flavoprotein
MGTKQRSDLNFAEHLLKLLVDDFPTAQETESLSEWADAVGDVAQYLAQRHRELYTDGE